MRFVSKNNSTDALFSEAQALLNLATRYNKSNRVREIIRILYSNCCAFCECSPEDGSFFQIEHFYPKSNRQFKRFARILENMHYSCQRCNTLKGRQVHKNIFSPNYFLDNGSQWRLSEEEKIETELFYVGHLLYAFNKTPNSVCRGSETIKLFDLNNSNNSIRSSRQSLVESRLRIFGEVFNIINILYELLSNHRSENNKTIELLFVMAVKYMNSNSPFSTMIIHNFGKPIYKLMLVYEQVR